MPEAKKAAPRPELKEIAQADHGALMSAVYTASLIENPDTVLQSRGNTMSIYKELLRDDQVMSTFQQRRAGVTSASWTIEPASEDPIDVANAEHQREVLDRIGWDRITDKMLYGLFYGYAVAEAMWEMRDGKVSINRIKVRDRARFGWNVRDELVMHDSAHPNGKIMPQRKFWTYNAGADHDDNPYGQGLAHSLYWPVFFKRSDIKFWLIFLEKFGMPTTAVRVPGGNMANPEEIAKARSVIASIQADSGVVIPDNMVVELIEAARSGTADYDSMREAMDKAISKVVLSQTMTTDDGSSLSQAQVHQGVAQAVIDSDADLIAESYRNTIGLWLTEWNFPGARPPHIVRMTEPEEDLSTRAERDGKIHQLGFDPTEEYIEETYGTGWVKREAAPVDPATLTSGVGPLPAEFAEVSNLLQARAGHRQDQQTLADAAAAFAESYRDIYGERVDRLLAYLEDSQDIDTFTRHLTEMLAEAPAQRAVDTVRNATFGARLMGLLRGQRRA